MEAEAAKLAGAARTRVAEQLDRRLVLFVEPVRLFALDAEHADQLAAVQERDAELAVRGGEAGQRDPVIVRAHPLLARPLVHGVGVEHLPDEAGDANRLAGFGDDAEAFRRDHREAWAEEMEEEGNPLSDDTVLVVEEFELVEVLDA